MSQPTPRTFQENVALIKELSVVARSNRPLEQDMALIRSLPPLKDVTRIQDASSNPSYWSEDELVEIKTQVLEIQEWIASVLQRAEVVLSP